MNKGYLGAVLLAAISLAACGGGGSSNGGPIPNPGPSNNPPVTYTATIRFVGPLAGATIQGALRQAIVPEAASTPIPIMIVSPADSSGCFGYECMGTSQQGVAQALVSPIPATAPPVSWTNTAPHVVVTATPTPAAGVTPAPKPTGVVSEQGAGSDGTINVQSAGTVTAAVGSPVNAQPSTAVYQYIGIGVDCIPATNFGNARSSSGPGWAYSGGAWVQVSDPAQADVYMTGSKCTGSYAVPADNGTLHFPGGGTFISTDTPFAGLSATQWANTAVSVAVSSLLIQNPDGSFNAELIAKTRDGSHTFKVFPNGFGGSAGNTLYDGAIEVSTLGVDGF